MSTLAVSGEEGAGGAAGGREGRAALSRGLSAQGSGVIKGPTLNRTVTLLGTCDREEGLRGPPFQTMRGPSHLGPHCLAVWRDLGGGQLWPVLPCLCLRFDACHTRTKNPNARNGKQQKERMWPERWWLGVTPSCPSVPSHTDCRRTKHQPQPLPPVNVKPAERVPREKQGEPGKVSLLLSPSPRHCCFSEVFEVSLYNKNMKERKKKFCTDKGIRPIIIIQ